MLLFNVRQQNIDGLMMLSETIDFQLGKIVAYVKIQQCSLVHVLSLPSNELIY